MKSPILGSAYVARSVNAADNRMVNLFPEMVPEGGKEPAYIQRTPGLKFWGFENGSYDPARPIRGMVVTYQSPYTVLYVVCADALYRVNSANSWVSLGTIDGDGLVSIANSGTELFIATDALSGYILTIATDTLTQIADPDFPGSSSVTYLDGRFIFCRGDDSKVWCTDLLAGGSIDPLNFASAESAPDPVVNVFANNGELWVFGTQTTEVWSNVGGTGFPFAPIQSASINTGCMGASTVCALSGTLFWLGRDQSGSCMVYMANGYSAQRVSTHAVEWQMQEYLTAPPFYGYNDQLPFAFGYQQDGHTFYVLTFPTSGSSTWVYDMATQSWHERAGYDSGAFARYRPQCHACMIDPETGNTIVNLVGDYEKNIIYTLDLDTYYDFDTGVAGYVPQKWLRTWRALPTGTSNLKRTAHHSLQLDCETGVHDTAIGPVVDPQVSLRWSDDGGHTWSNARSVNMGATANYSKRVIWRRLGATMKLRDRVYEVSGTDAVKIAIMGAELILSPTDA